MTDDVDPNATSGPPDDEESPHQQWPDDVTPIARLPVVIGVIGAFHGRPSEPRKPLTEHSFVDVRRANFGDVMRRVKPRLAYTVSNTLTGEGLLRVELDFTDIDDFDPANVARRIHALDKLVEARSAVRNVEGRLRATPNLGAVLSKVIGDPAAVDRLCADYDIAPETIGIGGSSVRLRLDRYDAGATTDEIELLVAREIRASSATALSGDERRSVARDLLRDLLRAMPVAPDNLLSSLAAIVGELDAKISEQLNRVIHAPEFLALEASWRSLHRLVCAVDHEEQVQVRLLDVSVDELVSSRGNKPDPITDAVCGNELESWGGHPVTLLVTDLPIDGDSRVAAVAGELATRANALVLTGARPELFGLTGLTHLQEVPDLAALFQCPECAVWANFRRRSAAARTVVTVPRVLVRRCSTTTGREQDFALAEDFAGPTEYPWGSAAYLLAGVLAQSFERHPFCGERIQGPGSSGELGQLPFREHDWDVDGPLGPAESLLSESQAIELARLGFTPAVTGQRAERGKLAFVAVQTCEAYPEGLGETPSRMPVEHRLVVSRVLHHAVYELRRTWGKYGTLDDCEVALNRRFATEVSRTCRRNQDTTLLKGVRIRLSLTAPAVICLDVEAAVGPVIVTGESRVWRDSAVIRLPH